MGAFRDLTGMVFGQLTVLHRGENIPEGNRSRITWVCRCSCGTVKPVRGSCLVAGLTISCGCIKVVHGMREHPLYQTWRAMLHRVDDEKRAGYKNYGGRGITVCARWRDFPSFVEDMGEKPSPNHTLERVDNDGPYSPENCVWATRTEQSSNRRGNVLITFQGETKTVKQWCTILGLSYFSIIKKVARGHDVLRIFTEAWGGVPSGASQLSEEMK